MTKKKAKIYSLKEKGEIIYIGKSIQLKDDLSNPSSLSYIYNNDRLNNIKDRSVEILEEVDVDNWFDPKLNQIVEKHKEGAKLRNGKHFLEGKRGYWSGTKGYWYGKKRDANTIKAMTESKYKEVCQYDLDGNLVGVWRSILDASKYLGYEVKKDYRGHTGRTPLNSTLKSKHLKNRERGGHYWIKKEEFQSSRPPIRISVKKIIEQQKKEYVEKWLETKRKNGTLVRNNNYKPVIASTKNSKKTKRFRSAKEAAEYYDISPSSVGRCCRYIRPHVKIDNGRLYFEYELDRHKNKYVENKRILDEKIAKKNQPRTLEFSEGKYMPILKRPISSYNKSDDSLIKSFKTLTLAGEYYNLKGKDIYNLIESENLLYDLIYFKYDV